MPHARQYHAARASLWSWLDTDVRERDAGEHGEAVPRDPSNTEPAVLECAM